MVYIYLWFYKQIMLINLSLEGQQVNILEIVIYLFVLIASSRILRSWNLKILNLIRESWYIHYYLFILFYYISMSIFVFIFFVIADIDTANKNKIKYY